MGVKKFSKPLQELEVVLILAFDQSLNFNMLKDAKFIESLLQNFEIRDILVVKFSLPIDFSHW